MNPSIYRASGYDFANLWMNIAKIAIALVFLYQNALETQLGVKLFEDYYYVFRVPVSRESEDEIEPAEVITPEDSRFSIDFKPMALGRAYDDFTVEVLDLIDPEGHNLLREKPEQEGPCEEGRPDCVRFSWDELTGGDKAVLQRASFDFLQLVQDDSSLVSGDYHVQFGFRFFRNGHPLGDTRRPETYSGTVKFLRQEQLRFGDVPVVQGRAFRIPRLILERIQKGGSWGGWDGYREVKVLEGGGEGGWKNGSILNEDLRNGSLAPARRLAAGRSYEQRGHFFDDTHLQVDFTIGFSLLKNEPPRSTYLGPGESDASFVRIFYEWHFFEDDGGYYYYNLSRHIIDPDGTTDPIEGRPDVRVRQFLNLRPPDLPYQLQRHALTGDWHLRVQGQIGDSLAPGSSHELTVVARDDFQDQVIRIRIER